MQKLPVNLLLILDFQESNLLTSTKCCPTLFDRFHLFALYYADSSLYYFLLPLMYRRFLMFFYCLYLSIITWDIRA